MDSKSLERFNFILSKNIIELSEDEISFLRARRDSLNAMQKAFYAELLPKEEVENTESEEVTEKIVKKSRSRKVETN